MITFKKKEPTKARAIVVQDIFAKEQILNIQVCSNKYYQSFAVNYKETKQLIKDLEAGLKKMLSMKKGDVNGRKKRKRIC